MFISQKISTKMLANPTLWSPDVVLSCCCCCYVRNRKIFLHQL